MNIYHFVYKTINIINNKYYYGVHSTFEINDGYLGSGVTLRKSIKKHGKQNFKREILRFFDDLTEAYYFESQLITEDVVNDPMSYNMCLGGHGAVGSLIPSEVTKHKMSQSIKKRWQLYGHPNKGKKLKSRNKEIYQRIYETKKRNGTLGNSRRGQKSSDETKKRQSQAALNRTKYECPNCNRFFDAQGLKRYHGDKCATLL